MGVLSTRGSFSIQSGVPKRFFPMENLKLERIKWFAMVCLEIVELLPSRVMNGPQMPSMSLFLYGRVPRLMTRHLIQSNLDFWRAIMWKIIKNKKFYYESSINDFFVNPLSSYGTFVCITFGLCKKKMEEVTRAIYESWMSIGKSLIILIRYSYPLTMV